MAGRGGRPELPLDLSSEVSQALSRWFVPVPPVESVVSEDSRFELEYVIGANRIAARARLRFIPSPTAGE